MKVLARLWKRGLSEQVSGLPAHKVFTNHAHYRRGGTGYGHTLTTDNSTSRLKSHGIDQMIAMNLANHGRKRQRLRKVLFYGVGVPYMALSLIPTYCLVHAGYHYGRYLFDKYRMDEHGGAVLKTAKQLEKQKWTAMGYLFYAVTGYLALPLSAVLLICTPYVYLFDPDERKLLSSIQILWARLTCRPFFSPTVTFDPSLSKQEMKEISQMLIEGKAVASDGTLKGVVYVANHSSWMDIYILLSLGLPLKFVAKKEIFYVPLVGWVMHFVGHLKLSRGSKSSGRNVIEQSIERINKGVAVFFFPEGTRNKTQVEPASSSAESHRAHHLLEFKKGGFIVAKKTNCHVLPLVLSGTQQLMPCSNDNFFYLDTTQQVEVEILKACKVEDVDRDRMTIREVMNSRLNERVKA